ncbi:MAG TPA: hypothetical protein VHF47_10260 [Acidimicrobiales bacterium]|nr:hypothetical protein [Acidimicrobiales bacterium]
MEHRGRRLSWWTGGVAGAGVLLTHWVTYRLALPDAHHRGDVLHDSGHAHWPVLSVVGLTLFTVASLHVCTLGWRRRPVARGRVLALRLAVLQAVAWTALEVGERALAGRLATLDDHGLVLLGLVVQVAVALAGAAFVRLTVRALSALAGRPPRVRPRPRSTPLPTPPAVGRATIAPVGAHGLRGPPAPQPVP